ncbi:hypothetical protein [Pedobacter sp. Hv1]|uniref:hypothetical protein n=1 Tax=Pedobacter sp. Hv1 TaxID=1740090 RepID=UPI0006D88D3E|nr:hypothetical protein [Pedobacter sp. Hv1]KQB99075.1 hypothetical protein AQF98_19175 [Pedobacter sp. Hv1]
MENQNINLCACCAHHYESIDIFCNTCGYPLQGTKQQQDAFIANRTVKEIDLVDLKKKIESARNSLYIITAFLGISGLFGLFFIKEGDDLFYYLISYVILVGAFLAFAVWSKTKPASALISGLSLYVIVQLLNIIADPATLFSGIIIKVLIIAYLIKGIIAVLEVDKIKKELNIK